ncbi:hypothetical protein M885DRAFT_321887 [Pelagophyceae sp. CCMP2097]|nr:hypothetical protein M885DRAFT_321887 [Pelagophyceae sp. CCMP2097]
MRPLWSKRRSQYAAYSEMPVNRRLRRGLRRHGFCPNPCSAVLRRGSPAGLDLGGALRATLAAAVQRAEWSTCDEEAPCSGPFFALRGSLAQFPEATARKKLCEGAHRGRPSANEAAFWRVFFSDTRRVAASRGTGAAVLECVAKPAFGHLLVGDAALSGEAGRRAVLQGGPFGGQARRGTHVSRTAEAMGFVIIEETAVAKGVRRIEAVTRNAAEAALATSFYLEQAFYGLEDADEAELP